MSNLPKVIVKRSEWIRGVGDYYSRLLCPDGKKCCIGFHALQILELTEEDIYNQPSYKTIISPDLSSYDVACQDLYVINDDIDIYSENKREYLIYKKGIEKLGVEFI